MESGELPQRYRDAVEDVVLTDHQLGNPRTLRQLARQFLHDDGAAPDDIDTALVHGPRAARCARGIAINEDVTSARRLSGTRERWIAAGSYTSSRCASAAKVVKVPATPTQVCAVRTGTTSKVRANCARTASRAAAISSATGDPNADTVP